MIAACFSCVNNNVKVEKLLLRILYNSVGSPSIPGALLDFSCEIVYKTSSSHISVSNWGTVNRDESIEGSSVSLVLVFNFIKYCSKEQGLISKVFSIIIDKHTPKHKCNQRERYRKRGPWRTGLYHLPSRN